MLGIVICEYHHFKTFSVGMQDDFKVRSIGQNILYNTVKV